MSKNTLTRRQRNVLWYIKNISAPLEYSFRGWGKKSTEMTTIHKIERPMVDDHYVNKTTLEALFKKGFVNREIVISRKDMIGNIRYIKHTRIYSV